ncbi:MAG: site-specific DNA-methyltransferase [Candidatus Methylomirabilales bacterium]
MHQIDSETRLKCLLRELFQLDVADLDFGLYRLFHLKRAEVEAFLDKQLPAEVDWAFKAAAGAEREGLQKRLEELAERARATVADDAILPSGEPNLVHASAKAVKEYAEARKRLQAVEATEAQRAEVFNLLYAFFSRYYDAGDFIPRRAYGARTSYAVPYNGEEVLFHWANKDQHYVKTGEAFRDYAFTVSAVSGLYRARFRLVEATVPKDNTKGDTRFFFPLPKEATFDEAMRTFTVPFHYRLPTEAEVAKYGKNAKGQEAILDEAAPKILGVVPDKFLQAALASPSQTGRETEGEEPPTLLRRRLSHFTKKNTTDYFVHKNLGGFLRQELEFFVRDQVAHEADLEGDFDAKRRTIRVFRKLAETVIRFLAQIEDAQKRLFAKKKFVLRTDYLVPIQHVPQALWPEVLANKAQLAEWKDLFALEPKSDLFNFKGQVNERVLEQHATLVVSTGHFSDDFLARLLASYENIDEATDGILIHSENYQALRLLTERFRQQIKCAYIDPPYNTGNDGFIYKDRYRHSTWASMLQGRLKELRALLDSDGVLFSSIDDNEVAALLRLAEGVFGEKSFAALIIALTNPRGRTLDQYIAKTHEYIATFVAQPASSAIAELPKDEYQQAEYRHEDEKGRYRLLELRNRNPVFNRVNRPNLYFPLFVNPKTGEVSRSRSRSHTEEALPRNSKGEDGCWTWGTRKVDENLALLVGKQTSGGVWRVFRKDYLGSGEELATTMAKSVWTDKEINHENGKESLRSLFGKHVYSFPKSVRLVQKCVEIGGAEGKVVLDFFAGSGTTGHAVIDLNRRDGSARKFILVECAAEFGSVVVPRIQKVMFSPEWKDGKPARLPTKEEAERTPRLVKVLRLESYEDALHNSFSDKAVERLAEREKAYREAVGDEEYRIRYLVKLPLEASDSMLNLAKLEHPFDYTLEVLTDHGPKTETVDLVETFNWLHGLRVHRLLTWVNEKDKGGGKEKTGRAYRAVVAGDREGKKRVLVVWRDMTDLDPQVERPFLEAKAAELGPFEEQWINGDTAAKGFASLDGPFKRLMEEGER